MEDNPSTLIGLNFSPESNLARYLQDIRKFPILEQNEEYELAVLYRKKRIKGSRRGVSQLSGGDGTGGVADE